MDCNVHCVYCHNARSKEVVSIEDFRAFLERGVSGVNYFQVGCSMEPTFDPRLADLMLLIAQSRAKPKHAFRLQTNGILLHRHNHAKMRDAGLTILTVSVDTLDSSVFRRLRGGTSLAMVKANLIQFHEACPEITLAFVTTVTSLNVKSISELVRVGLDFDVTAFNLRQVFYYPDSKIVDHSQMPELLVRDDEFLDMAASVQAKYGRLARFHILSAQAIVQAQAPVTAESLLTPRLGQAAATAPASG